MALLPDRRTGDGRGLARPSAPDRDCRVQIRLPTLASDRKRQLSRMTLERRNLTKVQTIIVASIKQRLPDLVKGRDVIDSLHELLPPSL